MHSYVKTKYAVLALSVGVLILVVMEDALVPDKDLGMDI